MPKITNKQVIINLLYRLLSKRQLLKTALTLTNKGNALHAEVTFSHNLYRLFCTGFFVPAFLPAYKIRCQYHDIFQILQVLPYISRF